MWCVRLLGKKQSFSKNQEAVDGVSRMHDVQSVVLSLSRRPSTPRSVEGVSAREDAMTGILLVYRRSLGTGMDDSALPVSVRAERVTSARPS